MPIWSNYPEWPPKWIGDPFVTVSEHAYTFVRAGKFRVSMHLNGVPGSTRVKVKIYHFRQGECIGDYEASAVIDGLEGDQVITAIEGIGHEGTAWLVTHE